MIIVFAIMLVTYKASFIAVTFVCVLLLLWMVTTSNRVVESRRQPYSNSSSTQRVSGWLWPQLSTPVSRKTWCMPVGGNISVLGKQPERCATPEADDIYISIKTTQNYHKTRVPILILTWLQTVRPEQVNLTVHAATPVCAIWALIYCIGTYRHAVQCTDDLVCIWGSFIESLTVM